MAEAPANKHYPGALQADRQKRQLHAGENDEIKIHLRRTTGLKLNERSWENEGDGGSDLHDSEINGEIGWFFDRVWRAKIGDPWNGYVAEKDEFISLGQAARWLCDEALRLYPNSNFARKYLRAHPGYRPQYPPGVA